MGADSLAVQIPELGAFREDEEGRQAAEDGDAEHAIETALEALEPDAQDGADSFDDALQTASVALGARAGCSRSDSSGRRPACGSIRFLGNAPSLATHPCCLTRVGFPFALQ